MQTLPVPHLKENTIGQMADEMVDTPKSGGVNLMMQLINAGKMQGLHILIIINDALSELSMQSCLYVHCNLVLTNLISAKRAHFK